jgi:hypothetical protein
MSTYGASTGRSGSTVERERLLSMIAGGLGILTFIWGFLKWFSVGEGKDEHKFGGYALETPSSAVIALSVAAGLIAFLGAMERRRGRGVPSAIPTGLAASAFLLCIAVLLGKGQVSPSFGDEVGVQVGLILALLTTLIQTVVLGIGLASRHDDGLATGTDAPPVA